MQESHAGVSACRPAGQPKEDVMTSRTRACVAAGTSVATALILTACNSASPGTGGAATNAAAVRGGTLNMLGIGDVDYMDPNVTYYSIGQLVAQKAANV